MYKAIARELADELERLRKNNAQLYDALWEQTDKALKLFDQCEPLRLERETLRHKLAQAREALTTYRGLHDEWNGDRPCLCGACKLARAAVEESIGLEYGGIMATITEDRMLRKAEVCDLTGLGEITIFKLERAGLFPRRRQLTARTVGWRLSEVMAWIESRPPVDLTAPPSGDDVSDG